MSGDSDLGDRERLAGTTCNFGDGSFCCVLAGREGREDLAHCRVGKEGEMQDAEHPVKANPLPSP